MNLANCHFRFVVTFFTFVNNTRVRLCEGSVLMLLVGGRGGAPRRALKLIPSTQNTFFGGRGVRFQACSHPFSEKE